MTAQSNAAMSVEEYLAFERASERKHEYRDGRVIAIEPVSYTHVSIMGNVTASLHAQPRERPCTVLTSMMRIEVSSKGFFTYPDVVVVCGQAVLRDNHRDTLLNPTLIVEVLSPETEAYDRGRKFHYYQALESLREYVLIGHDCPCIERYVRSDQGTWLFADTAILGETVHLPAIDCTLTLADVYEKVDFSTDRFGQ
jgi:Uma2 family endonuclease